MAEVQLTFETVSDWPAPPARGNAVSLNGLGTKPVWTETKAKLIAGYLKLFLFITKHGTYIDGFAGPQNSEDFGSWAAKLVLELRPEWLRKFFLCELNTASFGKLQEMVNAQEEVKSRKILETKLGDFNMYVDEVLTSGNIKEKEATFALLDQRSFECDWATVCKLAGHKKSGNKIELFYFFPTGWLNRSISGLKNDKDGRMEKWWGDASWKELLGKRSHQQVAMMVQRIQALGYVDVKSWPICEHENGGRVMYHMIHATDHLEAPKLMYRSYRKVDAGGDVLEQLGFDY